MADYLSCVGVEGMWGIKYTCGQVNGQPAGQVSGQVPSMEKGFLEMNYTDTSNHPHQKYRLTDLGIKIKANIAKSKIKK